MDLIRRNTKWFGPGLLILLSLWIAERPVHSQDESASAISVAVGVIAEGVENHVPISPSSSFGLGVGKLYCFTRITTKSYPVVIKHLWFHGDKFVMEIQLPVKSPNWRTYSSKTILPSATGDWRVDVTTEDGMILKTLRFTIR